MPEGLQEQLRTSLPEELPAKALCIRSKSSGNFPSLNSCHIQADLQLLCAMKLYFGKRILSLFLASRSPCKCLTLFILPGLINVSTLMKGCATIQISCKVGTSVITGMYRHLARDLWAAFDPQARGKSLLPLPPAMWTQRCRENLRLEGDVSGPREEGQEATAACGTFKRLHFAIAGLHGITSFFLFLLCRLFRELLQGPRAAVIPTRKRG